MGSGDQRVAAFHEAGHVVMAYAHGVRLGPAGAVIGHDQRTSIAEPGDYEVVVKITIAGHVADGMAFPESAWIFSNADLLTVLTNLRAGKTDDADHYIALDRLRSHRPYAPGEGRLANVRVGGKS